MKKIIIMGVFSLVTFMGGMWLIVYGAGWKVALGVFLFGWSLNIESHVRKQR